MAATLAALKSRYTDRCHWFFAWDDAIVYFNSDWNEELPFTCDDCLQVTSIEMGRGPAWMGSRAPEARPVHAHRELERPLRFIYVLKLEGSEFYVGQTTNLNLRLREHRDGTQSQTKGKDPRLVYFETFRGHRSQVNEVEDDLTHLAQTPEGRRRLMEMVEDFREPLRLLDLEA